jgi:hypothetical protein
VLVPGLRERAAAADLVAPGDAWRVVALVGAVLGVVGWLDWLLLWIPFRLGNPDWEFATASAAFDAMPLGTIGVAALAAGAGARGWRWVARSVGAGCWIVAAVLLGIYAVYVLDVPVMLKGVDPLLKPVLLKAIGKTSVFALVYVVTYLWLGVACWRMLRDRNGRMSS